MKRLILALVLAASMTASASANTHVQTPKHPIPILWVKDAECETGVSPPEWRYGKPGYLGEHSGYEGGIAFAPSTWRWWGREIGAYPRFQHAWDAPAWLQAKAAQWGLTHIGIWGCLRHAEVWKYH